MGLWKILGYTAAGIGAVACLPVAGAVGAVTLTGAIVGGAVGATVGGIATSKEEEEKAQAESSGYQKAKDEDLVQLEKMEKLIEHFSQNVDDTNEYFQLIVALSAIGIAVANADGDISEEEMANIDEFIGGIAQTKLPPHIKGKLTRMKNKPPTFDKAIAEVKKLKSYDPNDFRNVIMMVAHTDGKFLESEKQLLLTWDEMYAVKEDVAK